MNEQLRKAKHAYFRDNKYEGEREDHYADFLSQKERCKICGKGLVFKGSRGVPESDVACLDHCHTHGHFRGFLCNSCNTGLGYFYDNPDLLKEAAIYLERNKPIL